jgi:hypothetical protein
VAEYERIDHGRAAALRVVEFSRCRRVGFGLPRVRFGQYLDAVIVLAADDYRLALGAARRVIERTHARTHARTPE